jgi:geranylgeranyl reductase family protein
VRFDVLVVGAGPAGVAAALTAHDRGLRTLVVDKATFPRDKTCGDGLTAQALRLLEGLGVDTPAVTGTVAVRQTVLVSPSGLEVELPLPGSGVYSAVVPRRELDDALVRTARARGIEVRTGVPLSQLAQTDDGLRALVGAEEIDAAHVVAADGHWSAVRRVREPESPTDLGTWHAVRQYFSGVEDARQWVLFEEDLLPGYAWVFPLADGRANVGFGVLRRPGVSGKDLKALWPDVLQRPAMLRALGPRAVAQDVHRAWPIPTTYDPRRLSDDRVLYVGDAASVVDPMTGEGIAQALETGILAADAIARGGDAAQVTTRYRDAVERALGRDLRFASLLQRVLGSSLGARGAIRAAGLTEWTRRNFARWMFEDYPRAVLLTPDRWRRGVLTGRGAFAAAS